MRFVVFALTAVLASACALPTKVLSASERSVVVQARVQDAGPAQAAADAECQKHGRKARLSMKATDNQFVFDCVR